jgi:uncharacterized protein YbaR (Trm112 family)
LGIRFRSNHKPEARLTDMLDQRLLEILVCPKCKGELEYRTEQNELVCHACRLRYEVRDDIPIMLIDEAKPL